MTQNILPDLGPVTAFLQGEHETYKSHRVLLETLRTELEEGRSELAASWGEYWYRGVPVRAMRESDYDESVRLREKRKAGVFTDLSELQEEGPTHQSNV